MYERRQDAYPLLRQFREFYVEVNRLRRLVEGGQPVEAAPRFAQALAAATESGPAEVLEAGAAIAVAEPEGDGVTLQVWQEMANFLSQKMFEVQNTGSSLMHDLMEELVYVMAAFADETFVCLMQWPGAAYWREHLMELRLFRSQISGQMIFRRIDNLLSRQEYEEELIAVYLMALSLGFKGRYLRQPEVVDGYRQRLYERIALMAPESSVESLRIFPEAYRHTVSEGAPVRLPDPRRWWWAVAGIVAAWLVISTIAWFQLTHSTRVILAGVVRALDQITERQETTGPGRKWNVVPFAATADAFRIELPSELPMEKGDAERPGGTFPILVAVTGPAGASPGPAQGVKAWLANGVIAFPTNSGIVPLKNRTVVSVQQVAEPPSGITVGGTTLLLSVQPGLSADDLALRPELIFPLGDAPGGVTPGEMVMYLPSQLPGSAQ